MLERWRERDVFRESVRRREGAEPFVFYEGPPTANGRPGSAPRARARVQGHLPALQDDARATTSSARAAGTATACRSRSPSSRSSASHAKDDIERYGIAEFNAQVPRVGVRVPRGLERALTERIGYWVDLDDAYRTLDADLRRVGLVGAEDDVGQATCSTRATRSSRTARADGTALSSHEVAQGYQDVEDPSRLRASSRSRGPPARCARATRCSSGRRRRGRSSPTPPSPSTPS